MKAIYSVLLLTLLMVGCDNKPPEATTTATGSTATTGAPPEHIDSLRRTYHLKDLERVTLSANGHDIKAWVMDDNGKRQEGMMWLDADSVADDDGMIFVFSQAEQQGFWMENTILALDIIFISDKKKVLNIQPGNAEDKTTLPSKGPAKYVLEMKQGAAKRLGIVPGTPVTIPDTVVSKQ